MLTSEQKFFIETLDKPLILSSNFGCSKTTLILNKLKFLIKEKKISKHRIFHTNGQNKSLIDLGENLIHEYSLQIPNFYKHSIFLDELNSKIYFLKNIDKFEIKSTNKKNKETQIANDLYYSIKSIKENGYELKDLDKLKFTDLNSKLDIFSVFLKYEQFKQKNHLYDESDILLILKTLLNKNETIRKEIQSKFDYFLIDDFEKISKVEFELLELISNKNNVSIAVNISYGDSNLLKNFKKSFKNFKEISSFDNYQNSKIIIETLNKFDEKNKFKSNSKINGKIKLTRCENESSQKTFIIDNISKIQKDESLGIVCRSRKESNEIRKYLFDYGINIKNLSISNIFKSEIVSEMINILKVLYSPKDANDSMFLILEKSGLCDETIRKISRLSSRNEKSIFKVITSKDDLSEYDSEKEIISKLKGKLDNLSQLKNSKVKNYDLILNLIKEFKLYESASKNIDKSQIISLNKFLEFVLKFSKIHDSNSLEHLISNCDIAKLIDIEEIFENSQGSKIDVFSLENIPNKQFDNLIIISLNEGRFPKLIQNNVINSPFKNSREDNLKNELKLFEKIISKCNNNLYLTYVKRFNQNSIDAKPSRFLEKLELTMEKFEKEISDFSIDIKDEIKIELLKKIEKLILNDNFDSAKSEVELLKDLFGKKDLNSFIRESQNPSYEKYLNRLEDKKLDLFKDIDTSKLVYSVSQLQTYDSCPKKYMYSYIYKVPSKSRHYFDFGTTIHEVLEFLSVDFDEGLSKEKLYVKGVKYMSEGWISKGYDSVEQEKEYYEKGLEIIKEFIETETKLRTEERKTLSQEKKFFIEIEGRTMMGIIDRVDKIGKNDFEILDYKTSKSMETSSSLSENMQLFVYALAIKEEKGFGKLPKKVGLWYVLHNKILSVEPKYENLEKVKKRIVDIMKKIESKNFNPTPTDFGCKYCDFNTICKDSKFQ